MPLSPSTLRQAILTLTDQTNPDFVGWPVVYASPGVVDMPATHTLVADNWASAARAYFAEMAAPQLLPGALDTAEAAFAAAVASALGGPVGDSPLAVVALQNAFVQMAIALVAGVAPANIAAPPPAPPVIVLEPPTSDPVTPAAALAATIDAWARTGLVGPPGPTPTSPWT